MDDFLLDGFEVVLHRVLRKEVVRLSSLVMPVARGLTESNGELHEVDGSRVYRGVRQ